MDPAQASELPVGEFCRVTDTGAIRLDAIAIMLEAIVSSQKKRHVQFHKRQKDLQIPGSAAPSRSS